MTMILVQAVDRLYNQWLAVEFIYSTYNNLFVLSDD